MKISEVMKDSKIKIHATINGHGILLITKAEVGVRDGLLVDSLTYFDEDLTFSEPSKVVAVNKRDGRSYEFMATRIGPVDTRYGKFHLIRCTDDGRIVNRRQAERYDIDKLGVIRIGDNKDIRNALVYDISMKGIAFILDSDTPVKKGDHIIASFRYDPNYFHFYACEATVVRMFTLNGQPAIGCTLDAMGADLVTLISSKKKEKLGLNVDDILGISDSPDEKIASGDKIPVNYSPQLTPTEKIEREKPAHRWELEEKKPVKPSNTRSKQADTGRNSSKENTSYLSTDIIEEYPGPYDEKEYLSPDDDTQYLSPEEAADLIPERSAEDIIQARAERVADVDPIDELTDLQDISSIVSAEDLAELASIEDRTPHNASGVKSDIVSPQKAAAKKKDAYLDELDAIEDRTPRTKGNGKIPEADWEPVAPRKQVNSQASKKSARNTYADPSSPNYINNRNKKATREDLEALTALENAHFNPSPRTKEKLDFISSVVSEDALVASVKKKSGAAKTKQPKKSTAHATPAQVKRTNAPVAPSEHQAKFVDAYQSSMSSSPKPAKAAANPAKASGRRSSDLYSDALDDLNADINVDRPSRRNTAKASSKNAKETSARSRRNNSSGGYFPDDYDGYFNQNGNSVDEGLFSQPRDDGFLTPEQIADIIELERISKNE